jgi:hypothetical protein
MPSTILTRRPVSRRDLGENWFLADKEWATPAQNPTGKIRAVPGRNLVGSTVGKRQQKRAKYSHIHSFALQFR